MMSEEAKEETPAEVTTEPEEEEVDYECPPEFNEKEELCKMFVGGLASETTDEDFKGLFSSFGEIKEAVVMRKNESKSDRLFGFVTFAKCDDLDDCLLARPHKYKEKELEVKRAIPKGQNDGSGHYKTKKLHLANVPEVLDEKSLKRYLKSRHSKKYGSIDEVIILKAKDEKGNLTDKNRGFGFITVTSEDFADRIAIAESKFILDGNNMRLSKAKPKMSAAGGGFRGRGQGFKGGRGGRQAGGWDDWSYGAYGSGYGYGYGDAYGYSGYDYYNYPSFPSRGGGYGRRYAPY